MKQKHYKYKVKGNLWVTGQWLVVTGEEGWWWWISSSLSEYEIKPFCGTPPFLTLLEQK
jgi:hypothetical protein